MNPAKVWLRVCGVWRVLAHSMSDNLSSYIGRRILVTGTLRHSCGAIRVTTRRGGI